MSLLAEYFARKHASRARRGVQGFAPAALARLTRHHWPCNVRELENVIEQATALGSEEQIVPGDLPAGLGETAEPPEPTVAGSASHDYHQTVERTKRELIVRGLERANNSYVGRAHTGRAPQLPPPANPKS